MSVPAGSGRRADPRGDGTGAVCCPPGRPAQLAERMNDRCCALGRWGQGELGGLGGEGSAVVGIARNSGVRGPQRGAPMELGRTGKTTGQRISKWAGMAPDPNCSGLRDLPKCGVLCKCWGKPILSLSFYLKK